VIQHARTRSVLLSTALALVAIAPSANAGVPECRNLRLEDITSGGCELRASANCSASCDRLGIYKKACATKLHTVCREECTVSPELTCTDTCTEGCTSQCDLGLNITCIHNCFGECAGDCEGRCAAAEDPAQCQATCEATCDGECDIQCRPLVDGDCYTHCIECCDGSCRAQANMDCQTTCQDEEFETCEHEFELECSGACDVDGALFCDGEYVLSGPDMVNCLRALTLSGAVEANVQAGGGISAGSLDAPSASAGCSMRAERSLPRSGVAGLGLLLGLAVAGLRRRRVERRHV
jgi:hypothetical protein